MCLRVRPPSEAWPPSINDPAGIGDFATWTMAKSGTAFSPLTLRFTARIRCRHHEPRPHHSGPQTGPHRGSRLGLRTQTRRLPGAGRHDHGRMLSKNLNPLKRFQHLLDALPLDCVFDGELCVLDHGLLA